MGSEDQETGETAPFTHAAALSLTLQVPHLRKDACPVPTQGPRLAAAPMMVSSGDKSMVAGHCLY